MHAESRGASLGFEAIGVPWTIETAAPLPDAVVRGIRSRIDDFDRAYSRYRADSLVRAMAAGAGRWVLPQDAAPLLDLYRRLYRVTGGAVTPLVGARLESLGLDAGNTLRQAEQLAPVPAWDDAIEWDGRTLTTREQVLLDVGAAGKGYLVDLVAEILRDSGVDEYVINASGDLVHRGDEAVRVALEHPSDPELAIGVYELRNAALCASATNRRRWRGLHHVLDGRTGEPAEEVVATWAIASTGLVADGVATALFFRQGSTLAAEFPANPPLQWVRMFADGRAEFAHPLNGEIFTV